MFLLLALACAPVDDTDSTAPTDTAADTADTGSGGPGTLGLSFRMDDDYLAEMDEPAVGTFRGSIYAEADATQIGPNEGAVSLLDFTVDGVDLTDGGGPTDVLYTTAPLDPQIVWVLGCLDADANDCDEGDPITVPNENKLAVVADAATDVEIYLGMLRP